MFPDAKIIHKFKMYPFSSNQHWILSFSPLTVQVGGISVSASIFFLDVSKNEVQCE